MHPPFPKYFIVEGILWRVKEVKDDLVVFDYFVNGEFLYYHFNIREFNYCKATQNVREITEEEAALLIG